MRPGRVLAVVSLMVVSAAVAWSARITGPSGYTLEAANGWTVKPNPGGLPELFVLGTRVGGFAPNLNVTVNPVPAGTTLAQIRAASPPMLKAVFAKWKLLASGNTVLAGEKAAFLEYTADMGTPKRTLWLRQVMVVRGSKVYTFTCTAAANRKGASAKAFGAMMKSVRWG